MISYGKRFSNKEILRTQEGVRYYPNVIYPEVPVTEMILML